MEALELLDELLEVEDADELDEDTELEDEDWLLLLGEEELLDCTEA